MTVSVHVLIASALAVTVGVFVTAYKFALREAMTHREHVYTPDIPRAEVIVGRSSQWGRGASKQRAWRTIQYVQAGIVAFGITAVFIMLMCMAGIVAVMLVA